MKRSRWAALLAGWSFDNYGWTGLWRDILAGLTVATVAVPQAMAYALIAGIEPRYGLYTAIIMTALASVLGSSSHLINGPTNAISIVVFSVAAGLSTGPDDPHRIEIVGLLAVLVGLIQILIALLRLGDLTRYISESVILGFMLGAGVLVALSQLPPLLGLPAEGEGHRHFLYRLWLTLTQGAAVQPACVAVGVGTLLLVVGLRTLKKQLRLEIPDHLIALLAASFLTWLLGWKVAVVVESEYALRKADRIEAAVRALHAVVESRALP